jgi:3'-phosphoadenosine 5'-phosphosulfate sulfotransferase (PAPS reductase)/FAD synthetase
MKDYKNISEKAPIIGWWSGGVTSAVACKLSISLFGRENVRLIFLDTKNEDSDTYRFKEICELWYGKHIETLSNPKYNSIQDVWYRYNSLNVANGAICSSELKRDIRRVFTNHNPFSYQVFGFDVDESRRAKAMSLNNQEARPIYPLLLMGLSKKDCIEIIESAGIEIPRAYKLGLNNNNCLQTGCVQGGIGYWQKMRRDFPEKFEAMAKVEHDLTDRKGSPVTMLRLKRKDYAGPLFLKPHSAYPGAKDISTEKGKDPKPLFECNGFCGTNDLSDKETEKELNYAE